MAYYRKLPSGKHNYVVRLPNGRRKSFTDSLKRVAQRQAEDFEAALRRGESLHLQDRKVTVAQWHERWLRARSVEPTTAAKERSWWTKHLEPQWGAWPLSSIGRADVAAWVKAMTHAGTGPPTVTGCYNLLSGMLSDAVLEGLIGASPCREIDLPKVVRPAPRWLLREEYGRIQLALEAMPHGGVWQAYVGLACFSGLRPGELGGLDVEHVDLERGLVRVQQVMTRHGLRDHPKSASSLRWVPFPPEVGALLWRVIGDRGQGPVFLSPSGERVSETNFRNRVWRPALERAGVEYVRPYITRATAASWLVQAGVPPIEIVRMLGHSSMALVNVYLHLAPDQHDRIRAAWAGDAQMTHGPNADRPHPDESPGGAEWAILGSNQ